MEFLAVKLRIRGGKVEGRHKLPMAMASLVNESSFRVFSCTRFSVQLLDPDPDPYVRSNP